MRRPRVRGLEAWFESRILPLFRRRTREVGELLPQLYLHGLAEGDFELALRGLLGDWRALVGLVDRAPEGGLAGGVRGLQGPALLRDLRARGLAAPRLVVGDGHLGIWGALAQVYPEAEEQRCWNHRISNVLAKLPQRRQAEARRLLTPVPYAPSRSEAERLKQTFQRWCQDRGLGEVAALLDHDRERMVTFYRFPTAHWKHLRTTNPVESPFAPVRLRTAAGKRYKKVANATAQIWKVLLVAESSFRRLDHPELLPEVAEGVTYRDGIRVKEVQTEAAA